MTPKEKAEELVEKYYQFEFNTISLQTQRKYAKQCALITVDEIINNFGTRTTGQEFYTEYRAVEYWQEVKTEIEKL